MKTDGWSSCNVPPVPPKVILPESGVLISSTVPPVMVADELPACCSVIDGSVIFTVPANAGAEVKFEGRIVANHIDFRHRRAAAGDCQNATGCIAAVGLVDHARGIIDGREVDELGVVRVTEPPNPDTLPE